MSRRPGAVVSVRRPYPGGESPNAMVGEISVEIRAHWPAVATRAAVFQALADAIVQSSEEITSHFR